MATAGLAINLMLWGLPGMVAASSLPHLIAPNTAPTLAQALASVQRNAGQTPSAPDALMLLIGAEAEAMQVAGQVLQQPTPADLAPRATAAGGRVLEAVTTYVHSAQSLLDQLPRLP